MLSPEDNDLLTQTGAQTPMGKLARRYWLPALLSEELPQPDGGTHQHETDGRTSGGVPVHQLRKPV